MMVKCSKCNSDIPSAYKHCIYCGNKMPVNPDNEKQEKLRAPFDIKFVIILAAFAAMAIAIIAFVLIEFK